MLTQRLREVTEEMHIVACYQKSAAFNAYQLSYVRLAAAARSDLASFVGAVVPLRQAVVQCPRAVSDCARFSHTSPALGALKTNTALCLGC